MQNAGQSSPGRVRRGASYRRCVLSAFIGATGIISRAGPLWPLGDCNGASPGLPAPAPALGAGRTSYSSTHIDEILRGAVYGIIVAVVLGTKTVPTSCSSANPSVHRTRVVSSFHPPRLSARRKRRGEESLSLTLRIGLGRYSLVRKWPHIRVSYSMLGSQNLKLGNLETWKL